MSIITRAMVLNLQVGLWMGYKLDKSASSELTTAKNAAHDAARVNTHLVSKEALKEVQTAASALRTHFYTHTLAWKDNGDRLIVREVYPVFIEEYARREAAFYAARDIFADTKYPSEVEAAAFRMGGLFDSSAYPSSEQVRRKFYAHLDIDTISTAGDFRVAMDQDEQEQIKQSIERSLHERMSRAAQDVWTRVQEHVIKLASLDEGGKRYHTSSMDSLRNLIDTLPVLNITDDQDLSRIHKRVSDMMRGIDVEDIRKDEKIRGIVAGEAKDILDQMKGFMNAFGQAA